MAQTKVKLISDGVIVQSNLHASHGITTAHIGEGSNLYYTNARSRAAISVSGNALSYNSSTGVITSNFEESPTFTGAVVGSSFSATGGFLNGSNGGIRIHVSGTKFFNITAANAARDNIMDIGAADARFKDLYLGGNIQAAGNVGIGTTSPSHNLHVVSAGNGEIKAERTSGAAILTQAQSALGRFGTTTNHNLQLMTNSAGRVTIDTSGEVGIGTTSPAAKLHVHATSGDGLIRVTGDNIINSGGTIKGFNNGLAFNVAASGGGSETEAIRIIGNGNVGIGTTSPSKKLHIYNTASADVALLESTQVFSTLAFKSSTNTDTAVFGIDGGGNAYIENKKSTHPILFTTNSNERMRITSGGNIGIGTTSPASKLEIFGTGNTLRLDSAANQSKTILLRNVGSGTAEIKTDGDLKLNAEDSGKTIQLFTEDTERMRITNTGTVTVGTGTVAAANAAADDFVITGPGTTATGMTISNTSDAGTGTIFFGDTTSSSAAGFRYNHNTGDMAISAEDNITFTCDNVGIGLTNPSEKLDVNGRVKWVTATGGDIYLFAGSKYYLDGGSNTYIVGESPDGDNIGFVTGGSTVMTIDENQNVGIGTTSPAKKLDIRTDNGVLIKGASGSTNAHLSFLPASGGREYAFSNAGSSFYIKDISADVTRMYFHYNGNTGINETAPATLLSLSGVKNTSIITLKSTTNDSNWSAGDKIGGINFFSEDGSGSGSGIKGSISYIATSSSGGSTAMTFNTASSSTNNIERMRIDASGNVGIGTTSPQNQFVIKEGSNVDMEFGSEGSGCFIQTYNRTSSAWGYLRFIAGGGEQMRIHTNGNVGIGNTSPGNKLNVVEGTSTWEAVEIQSSSTTGCGITLVGADTSVQWSIIANASTGGAGANNLGFHLTGAGSSGGSTGYKMTIQASSGNVGIGTTSPTNKFVVRDTGSSFSSTIHPSTATIISKELTDNAYHSILQLVAVRQSLTTGKDSQGYLGFSTIDDSNNQGMKDAGRIAIVNETTSARNSATALSFWTNPGGSTDTVSAVEKMRISSSGRITMPGLDGKTQVHPDVSYQTSSGELFYQTSSERYKTDIVNLESSLNKINSLRPVRFTDINTNEPGFGLIAEETNEVIPEVVFSKDDQIEGISYSNLAPFLIKAIQEQQEIINDLKNRIQTLENN